MAAGFAALGALVSSIMSMAASKAMNQHAQNRAEQQMLEAQDKAEKKSLLERAKARTDARFDQKMPINPNTTINQAGVRPNITLEQLTNMSDEEFIKLMQNKSPDLRSTYPDWAFFDE